MRHAHDDSDEYADDGGFDNDGDGDTSPNNSHRLFHRNIVADNAHDRITAARAGARPDQLVDDRRARDCTALPPGRIRR